MFCTNCGNEVSDQSKFCKNCGAQIKRRDANAAQVTTDAQAEVISNTQNDVVSNRKTVKVVFSRRKRMMGWAIPIRIHIDGERVANLANGASQEVDVPCGVHKVIFDSVGEVYEKEIDFSAEYSKIYVNLVLRMGLVTGIATIESIVNEK